MNHETLMDIDKEPSDEMLEGIMKEVAIEAKVKALKAEEDLQKTIQLQMAIAKEKYWPAK